VGRRFKDCSAAIERFEFRHVRPNSGRTLIVGSAVYMEKEDRRLRYADVLGVDMLDGEGVDRVLDLEEPLPDDLGTFAHVECLSVLEHSRRPWLLAANIERLMDPGATLYVTAPFIWRVHAYPNDYFRYTLEGLKTLFSNVEFSAMSYAHERLTPKSNVPWMLRDDHLYFCRTEVCGFGARR